MLKAIFIFHSDCGRVKGQVLYSVMQSDWNNCVVMDSFNKASGNEDNFLGQT